MVTDLIEYTSINMGLAPKQIKMEIQYLYNS